MHWSNRSKGRSFSQHIERLGRGGIHGWPGITTFGVRALIPGAFIPGALIRHAFSAAACCGRTHRKVGVRCTRHRVSSYDRRNSCRGPRSDRRRTCRARAHLIPGMAATGTLDITTRIRDRIVWHFVSGLAVRANQTHSCPSKPCPGSPLRFVNLNSSCSKAL